MRYQRCILIIVAVLILMFASRAIADRKLRYRPEKNDIVIKNGHNRFNRPLYGTNTPYFVYAGDLPEIMMALPAKGGTLWLGIARNGRSKWLSSAKQIEARYRPGMMLYKVEDALLGDGSLKLEVIPMADAEGAIIKVETTPKTACFDLIWAFGGASGYNNNNLDTVGYCPEEKCLLMPEDCNANEFKLVENGFELLAPCHGIRPIIGIMPSGSKLKICDANALHSPVELLSSSKSAFPILAGTKSFKAGQTEFFGLEWVLPGKPAVNRTAILSAFEAAKKQRQKVAEQIQAKTPDEFINASIPALCHDSDGTWEYPTYLCGAMSWRARYLGWRQGYIGTNLGWDDRALAHLTTYGKIQYKNTGPLTAKPSEEYLWARQAFDSILYSRGYIPCQPSQPEVKMWYNMNEVYADTLVRHFLWMGDMDFVKQLWPVLVDHLAWEKRCFDPDNDGLYENYANIWLSDCIQYSGGAGTIATSYTYFANKIAARLAKIIGEDATPFEAETKRILESLNNILWMKKRGWYAENRDLLGLKKLHPSTSLQTIFHAIDSQVPNKFQAYQALRYVDTSLEHVPVGNDGYMVFITNWLPFIWCGRNVAADEVGHAALAYWQSGRRQKAYQLFKGTILDGMYYSRAPGNCIGFSELDPEVPGLCGSWGDTAGVYARAVTEGLFGINPDLLSGELLLRFGFPSDWEQASIDTPDIKYSYNHKDKADKFEIEGKFSRPLKLRLQMPASSDKICSVIVNGKVAQWKPLENVGEPRIEIAGEVSDSHSVEIKWSGNKTSQADCPKVVGFGQKFSVSTGSAELIEVYDPQGALKEISKDKTGFTAVAAGLLGHRTAFTKVRQGGLIWWQPVEFEIRQPYEILDAKASGFDVSFMQVNNTDNSINIQAKVSCGESRTPVNIDLPARSKTKISLAGQRLLTGTNLIAVDMGKGRIAEGKLVEWNVKPDFALQNYRWDKVDLSGYFNDRLTEIFKHEYRSPRSPYCSLQIPLHGVGDWCDYNLHERVIIDDSALRKSAGEDGNYITPQGIPFATSGPGDRANIVFTSLWDNFPDEVEIPLSGRARQLYLLMTGSTNHMQSQFDNGEVLVTYTDGSEERLALHNPTTWWPIEKDYDVKKHSWCIPGPYPPRISLGKGKATVLDVPLNPRKQLKSLKVHSLANEVIVGLMSATLLR